MRYTSRTLLSAAAIVALGAGVVLYAYRDSLSALDDVQKELEERRLFRFDPSAVTGGEVTTANGTVRFERSHQGFRITAPVEAAADSAAIDSVIAAMASASSASQLAVSEDAIRRYGLESPRVRIALELGNEKAELLVGIENEFDKRWYVRNPALDTIGLAPAALVTAVDKDLFALREKRLVFFDPNSVVSVETARGDGNLFYRIEKTDSGYHIVAPEKMVADPLEVQRVIEAVLDTRAKSFADDTGTSDPAVLARYGLEPPAYRVTIALASNEPVVLRLGSARGEDGVTRWYARFEGTRPIAEVRETLYRDLARPAAELQDKRVLDFMQSQVGRIRFEREGKTFEIEKNGESWELRSPSSGKVAAFKVSAILYTLERLRSLKFDTTHPGKSELKIRGFEPSRATLTLLTKDGADLDALSIGKPSPTDPKQWFVMGKRAARIDLIDAAELASLPKGPEDLN